LLCESVNQSSLSSTLKNIVETLIQDSGRS